MASSSSGQRRRPAAVAAAAAAAAACSRPLTNVLRVAQQLNLAAVHQPQQLVADVARPLHAAHLQQATGQRSCLVSRTGGWGAGRLPQLAADVALQT